MSHFLKQKPGTCECAPIAIFNAIRYKYPYFDVKKYNNIRRRCQTGKATSGTTFTNTDQTINNYHQYFYNIMLSAQNRSPLALWDQLNHHVKFDNRTVIVNLIHKTGLIDGLSHTVLITSLNSYKYKIVGLKVGSQDNISIDKKLLRKYFDISVMWVLFYEEEKELAGHYLDYDDIELGRYKI